MYACSFDRFDIVRYLLSTGKCNVNAVDKKYQTALIYATNSSIQLSKEMIELLIKNGADVSCENYFVFFLKFFTFNFNSIFTHTKGESS